MVVTTNAPAAQDAIRPFSGRGRVKRMPSGTQMERPTAAHVAARVALTELRRQSSVEDDLLRIFAAVQSGGSLEDPLLLGEPGVASADIDRVGTWAPDVGTRLSDGAARLVDSAHNAERGLEMSDAVTAFMEANATELDIVQLGGFAEITTGGTDIVTGVEQYERGERVRGVVRAVRGADATARGGLATAQTCGAEGLAGAAAGTLLAQGVLDVGIGVDRIIQGDVEEGAADVAQGSVATAGGIVAIAASGPAAPIVAASLGAAALAVKLGRNGNRAAKELVGVSVPGIVKKTGDGVRDGLSRLGATRDGIAAHVAAGSTMVVTAPVIGAGAIVAGAGATVYDLGARGERFGTDYLGGVNGTGVLMGGARAAGHLAQKLGAPEGGVADVIAKGFGGTVALGPAVVAGVLGSTAGILEDVGRLGGRLGGSLARMMRRNKSEDTRARRKR